MRRSTVGRARLDRGRTHLAGRTLTHCSRHTAQTDVHRRHRRQAAASGGLKLCGSKRGPARTHTHTCPVTRKQKGFGLGGTPSCVGIQMTSRTGSSSVPSGNNGDIAGHRGEASGARGAGSPRHSLQQPSLPSLCEGGVCRLSS